VLEMPILWLPELRLSAFLWHSITTDLRWCASRVRCIRVSPYLRWPGALRGFPGFLGTQDSGFSGLEPRGDRRQQPCPRRHFSI